jgi:hypothetical protein
LNWLAAALERLAELERILDGRPLPGSRRPAPERSPGARVLQRPPAEPLPPIPSASEGEPREHHLPTRPPVTPRVPTEVAERNPHVALFNPPPPSNEVRVAALSNAAPCSSTPTSADLQEDDDEPECIEYGPPPD